MPYAELHCHTAYSFLDGASHPQEIAGVAAEQGHAALAITDHDGLHGSMEAAQALKPLGVRAITGTEVSMEDGSHLTLLCKTKAGYANLCRLLTEAHKGTRPRPGQDPLTPITAYETLKRHSEGLVCLSGCARHGPVARAIEGGRHAEAAAAARRLQAIFKTDLRIELQRPFARHDRRRNCLLSELAERIGAPCVATGNVHSHSRGRTRLQDALVAVRLGRTLDECEPQRRGNSSHAIAPPEAMAARFAEHPEAVEESGRLAERLAFDITSDLGYTYPGSEDPEADRKLAEACAHRIGERYPRGRAREKARARLDEELRVIRHLDLSGFFLLHRDMLELAREVAAEVRGADEVRAILPPGRGRGSSVASIVCYLTGLSHIDPLANELQLGRFLNEDLTALPDIDLDFPRDIREALIPRVHERYGHDRSALVAAFATYQVRSAVRDFAKALGLPPGEIERLARTVDPWKPGNDVAGDVPDRSPRWRALVQLCRMASGLPRHQSQHPGGMVISTRPLIDLCPIQPAAMEGRQMVQWDKDSCADAGFLKLDLLGLGMLSAVERCVVEIERTRNERIDLSRIDFDDRPTYEAIQAAETTGVFQIESRAQMSMLPRTHPENLDDLTVQVALVRPGPIQGGAVHPYIKRKKALREDPAFQVPYEHPLLEPVLKDTLGAIVFQDQVIEVAMAFAGFTAGDAEGLRRAMSRKRSEAAMRAYERQFIEGAVERGAHPQTAQHVYDQIVGFSGFGFPKSHSAAFGLLAYQSTWLRVHYGPEFLCALMNEQPMGFYPSDALVHEAQRRGIAVAPPCVVESGVECRTDVGGAVRMGLGYVNGVREAEVRSLVEERSRSGWHSVEDLAARSGASVDTLAKLAWAGACDSLVDGPEEGRRRQALWLLGVAAPGVPVGVRGKVGTQLALPLDLHDAPELRELGVWDRLLADYGSTGVTLREHPLELMRGDLPGHAVTSTDLDSMRDGSAVTIAGLVIARQRPATAKGVTFMLLEDEHGTLNLIVPPPVHERCRLAVRGEPLVIADGKLERREGIVNVLVHDVRRLERGDLPKAEVRHIEPSRTWSSEAGEGDRGAKHSASMPNPSGGAKHSASMPNPSVPRSSGGPAGGQQLRPRAPLATRPVGRGQAPRSVHAVSGRILVGTSSWADPGFIKDWYPQKMPAGERLPWYAKRFEAVELNSSFYAVPERPTVRRWCEVTPDGFVMDVKLHRLLSRHSAGIDSLPPPLREVARTTPRGRVELTPELEETLAKEVLGAIEPLVRAGRMGALLLQLTPAFSPKRNELAELEPLIAQLKPHRLAIELRNRRWVDEERVPETLGWFDEQGVAFVCVDAPPGDATPIMPAVDAVTRDDLAYVRIHGRNTDGYLHGKSVAERFGWVYGDEELEEIAIRASRLADEAGEVHVFFNNNRDDDAPTAARRFRALLGQDPGPPPEDAQLRLA